MIPAGIPLREMMQQLEVFQPDHLVGYVSIVEELAAMMLNGALQPLPHWIASNSEPCCRR